jgi:hypothetical protein
VGRREKGKEAYVSRPPLENSALGLSITTESSIKAEGYFSSVVTGF